MSNDFGGIICICLPPFSLSFQLKIILLEYLSLLFTLLLLSCLLSSSVVSFNPIAVLINSCICVLFFEY